MEEKNVITTETVQDKTVDDVSSSETIQETTTETKETIEETLKDTIQEKKETVPLSKYMDEKKQRQSLEKRLDDLEKNMNSKTTAADVASDIAEIAEEYDINPDFLAKLEKSFTAKIERENQEKLKPIIEEREKAKFDATFDKKLADALAEMPEYKTIVNSDVLKQLVLSRDSNGKLINGGKTFEQLIEDTYSNAIGGKRVLETAAPGGKKDSADVDFDRARKDQAYFSEIMANPTLKAKYNSNIEQRLNL